MTSRIPPSDKRYGAAFDAADMYARTGILQETPRGDQIIRRLRYARDAALADGFEVVPFEEHWIRDVDANIYLFHLRALAAGNPSGDYDPLNAHELCLLTADAIRICGEYENPELREHLSMQVFAALLWQMEAVADQVRAAMRYAEDDDDHEVQDAIGVYHEVARDVRETYAALSDLDMPRLVIDSVQQVLTESES